MDKDGLRACALRAGEVWCWGAGTTVATKVEGIDGVVALVVEFYHTCALRQDATVWCWGGTMEDYNIAWPATPTPVPDIDDALAIWEDSGAGLGGRTCVLHGDFSTTCVGNGEWTPGGIVPPMPVLDRAGSCALVLDGTVHCQGLAFFSGLPAFEELLGVSGAVAIARADLLYAALLADGTVRIWRLGTDDGSALPPRAAFQVEGLTNAVRLTGGSELCALDADGAVWCFGGKSSSGAEELRRVADGDPVAEYVGGTGAACLLRVSGVTQCSGVTGLVGELGVDSGGFVDVPGLPAP